MPAKVRSPADYDSQDEANTELLEKLKHLDRRAEAVESGNGICSRSSACWQSLKLKSALNHIGLLVSLSIYCGVGGLVSNKHDNP